MFHFVIQQYGTWWQTNSWMFLEVPFSRFLLTIRAKACGRECYFFATHRLTGSQTHQLTDSYINFIVWGFSRYNSGQFFGGHTAWGIFNIQEIGSHWDQCGSSFKNWNPKKWAEKCLPMTSNHQWPNFSHVAHVGIFIIGNGTQPVPPWQAVEKRNHELSSPKKSSRDRVS